MSAKNMETVPLQIKKLEGAGEVHQCAELMANSEPWITLGRTYEDSVQILNDPAREVYVAVVGDRLVGFIILWMRGAFVGYMQTVAVAPEWRSQGMGSRLIGFAEERIFRDAPNAFICVSSFNEGAQKLYLRLGYHVVGELKDYIIRGHSEILMRKTIAPLAEFRGAR